MEIKKVILDELRSKKIIFIPVSKLRLVMRSFKQIEGFTILSYEEDLVLVFFKDMKNDNNKHFVLFSNIYYCNTKECKITRPFRPLSEVFDAIIHVTQNKRNFWGLS